MLSNTPLSVILVETHLEQALPSDTKCPPDPFWLGYQPPHQEPGDQKLDDLWRWYAWRWPVEPSIRFRKQYLHWTLPQFQRPECCDRWTMLVNVAQWQLFLARDVSRITPGPDSPFRSS